MHVRLVDHGNFAKQVSGTCVAGGVSLSRILGVQLSTADLLVSRIIFWRGG